MSNPSQLSGHAGEPGATLGKLARPPSTCHSVGWLQFEATSLHQQDLEGDNDIISALKNAPKFSADFPLLLVIVRSKTELDSS